jgi:D-glycero-alpha-D-manno-heptose-7-phosphate kinase
MDLFFFQILESSTLKDALVYINKNKHGVIFAKNSKNQIVGIATDGDIRTKLLEGIGLEVSIGSIVNRNFIWATNKTPRELLLKQLDNSIKVIPILNDNKEIIDLVSRNYFPIISEKSIFSRSKSPVRISFGGGGSDTSNYFKSLKGVVISATISLYSHCTLKIRSDLKIIIDSIDLEEKIEFGDINELLNHEGSFSLIKNIIKAIMPAFGFELYIHSDFPINSGLGGSAVVSSAILGCFNQFRSDKWDKYEIAEIAFQAERLHLGIAGGWQDQYASVFGGFNFMEFNFDQNIINPIRLNSEILLELEESLILCYTGITHNSGNIHNDQKEQSKSVLVKERIKSNVKLTFEMRDYLLKGNLFEFGKCLHKSWGLKKGFSSKISNPILDEIYEGAINNGAIGGKLLGAGGGGFFLFYVQPFDKLKFMNWLKEKKLKHTPFIFEEKGLQSWTVREKNGINGN